MAARRFDTDTLLEQLLEHNEDAFKAIYERYRGRVYRFIVRQCGNGEAGQAEYLSIWANLVKSRMHCKDGKSLKLAFLKSLQRPTFKLVVNAKMVMPFTLMPRELEEEGGWSTLLVEMVRRLPEEQRKRFLFRYEIGLSSKAIAAIFNEDRNLTRQHLQEAENKLCEVLKNAGCKMQFSLDDIYRETRSLKPPTSWDQEVLSAYRDWMANGVPEILINLGKPIEPENRLASMKKTLRSTLEQLRSDFSAKLGNSNQSTT